MDNKILGGILLTIGIVIGIILVTLVGRYNQAIINEGCFPTENCQKIESSLSISHFGFGIIGFILALGFYLLVFSRSEEAILNRLEEEKRDNVVKEKFNLVLKGLDSYEKKVMEAVKEQEGITQSTLRIRTDMSKAKLSYVVNDLEDRGLVKRIKKGKTFSVFLRENFA